MFCPKCDAVLILKKGNGKSGSDRSQIVICRDCNLEIENNVDINGFLIKQEIDHGVEVLIEIIESTDEEDERITKEMREELSERYREAPIYFE